jgi:hypothetical protein
MDYRKILIFAFVFLLVTTTSFAQSSIEFLGGTGRPRAIQNNFINDDGETINTANWLGESYNFPIVAQATQRTTINGVTVEKHAIIRIRDSTALHEFATSENPENFKVMPQPRDDKGNLITEPKNWKFQTSYPWIQNIQGGLSLGNRYEVELEKYLEKIKPKFIPNGNDLSSVSQFDANLYLNSELKVGGEGIRNLYAATQIEIDTNSRNADKERENKEAAQRIFKDFVTEDNLPDVLDKFSSGGGNTKSDLIEYLSEKKPEVFTDANLAELSGGLTAEERQILYDAMESDSCGSTGSNLAAVCRFFFGRTEDAMWMDNMNARIAKNDEIQKFEWQKYGSGKTNTHDQGIKAYNELIGQEANSVVRDALKINNPPETFCNGNSIEDCHNNLRAALDGNVDPPEKNPCRDDPDLCHSLIKGLDAANDHQRVSTGGGVWWRASLIGNLLNPDQATLGAVEYISEDLTGWGMFKFDQGNIIEYFDEDIPSKVCRSNVFNMGTMFDDDYEGLTSDFQTDKVVGGGQGKGSTRFACLGDEFDAEEYSGALGESIDENSYLGSTLSQNQGCLELKSDLRGYRTPLLPDGTMEITYSYFLRAPENVNVRYVVVAHYNSDIWHHEIIRGPINISEGQSDSGTYFINLPINHSEDFIDTEDFYASDEDRESPESDTISANLRLANENSVRLSLLAIYVDEDNRINEKTYEKLDVYVFKPQPTEVQDFDIQVYTPNYGDTVNSDSELVDPETNFNWGSLMS